MILRRYNFINLSFFTLIVSYIFYVFLTQAQIEKDNGFGWDGVFYHSMYQNFKGNGTEVYNSKFPLFKKSYEHLIKTDPFNKRVAVPFLASLMPFSEVLSFKILNLIGFFGGTLLLLIKWSKKSLTIALLFLLYLIISPQIPFRFTLFYPVHVDGVQFFFISLIIYFWNYPKYVFLASILFLPFKETAIPICCIYFGSKIICEKSFKYIIYIFISLLIYFVYLKFLAHYLGIIGKSNSIEVLSHYIKYNFTNYKNMIKLISCLLVVFSYFIFIKRKITFKTIFFASLTLLLSISGSDTTRILFIALPFLLDEIIEIKKIDNNLSIFILMLVFSIPYKFIFSNLEFSDLDNIGEKYFIMNLEYRPLRYSMYFLLYFVVTSFIIFKYKKYIEKRSKNSDHLKTVL